jgi:LmbE family N-acetylglucosaminyl deacetylase
MSKERHHHRAWFANEQDVGYKAQSYQLEVSAMKVVATQIHGGNSTVELELEEFFRPELRRHLAGTRSRISQRPVWKTRRLLVQHKGVCTIEEAQKACGVNKRKAFEPLEEMT